MLQRIALIPEPGAPSGSVRKARELRVGGLTPFTTIDFPGKLGAVVFVQGCPWRCGYCHNPHLQPRAAAPALTWPAVLDWLARRVGLLDGVVFSGGEPTADPELGSALRDVRRLGFAVGLHSAGTHPRRLQALLPSIDWVGLDVKAPLDTAAAYARITGVPGSAGAVSGCVQAVLASGVAYEVRTTIHPSWLDDLALLRLGRDLAGRGVSSYALQLARSEEGAALPVADAYPAPATLAELASLFDRFELRRG